MLTLDIEKIVKWSPTGMPVAPPETPACAKASAGHPPLSKIRRSMTHAALHCYRCELCIPPRPRPWSPASADERFFSNKIFSKDQGGAVAAKGEGV